MGDQHSTKPSTRTMQRLQSTMLPAKHDCNHPLPFPVLVDGCFVATVDTHCDMQLSEHAHTNPGTKHPTPKGTGKRPHSTAILLAHSILRFAPLSYSAVAACSSVSSLAPMCKKVSEHSSSGAATVHYVWRLSCKVALIVTSSSICHLHTHSLQINTALE